MLGPEAHATEGTRGDRERSVVRARATAVPLVTGQWNVRRVTCGPHLSWLAQVVSEEWTGGCFREMDFVQVLNGKLEEPELPQEGVTLSPPGCGTGRVFLGEFG